MNASRVVVTGAIGVALLGATMLQARNASRPTQGAAAVAPGPSERGVAAEGRVVACPGAEVKVGAERAGRLVAVLVREGDPVRKGQLLAELESDELRAGLAEAQARVAEAEAEIRLAEASLGRRRQLVEQQIATAHDLDQAQRDLEIARARRETAAAEATRYDAQLRKTRIVAPISGTVIAREVDAGETLDAGAHAFTVADLTRLRIEGEADEADADALALGARVAISSDGYPGRRFEGRVEEVADSVTRRRLKPEDPSRPTDTRVIAVKVAFAEKTPLKLGTTVELRVFR